MALVLLPVVALAVTVCSSPPSSAPSTSHESTFVLDDTWNSVVEPYLKDDLWTERDAYDAGHYLMVPLHAAFEMKRKDWQRSFQRHLERFLDARRSEFVDDRLTRLQYLYLWSRFSVLAAESDRLGLVPTGTIETLLTTIERLWVEEPAQNWGNTPFVGMRERLAWKLRTPSPERSYYRAIIDEELFLFSIAADLAAYHRLTATDLTSPVPRQVLDVARRVFEQEVTESAEDRWLFQPGAWTDHPDYAYAGQSTETTGMTPKPVPGIALDSSHSHRFPLWLRSLASAYPPKSEERLFYLDSLDRLEEQFIGHVLEPPSSEFDGYRLRNFMDGRNGVYRWAYPTHGTAEGYGPYELSGTLLLGWWSFLGSEQVCAMYADIAQQFPIDPRVQQVYIGPNTTRDRHPLVADPASYENGFRKLIVTLASELCE